MKEHEYKGGRMRPENVLPLGRTRGGVRRGICRVCGGPKKAHTKF